MVAQRLMPVTLFMSHIYTHTCKHLTARYMGHGTWSRNSQRRPGPCACSQTEEEQGNSSKRGVVGQVLVLVKCM
jgi:hypothetical protein